MARHSDRDFYGYLPGFAFILVLAVTLAVAPSVIPRPVREALGLAPSRLVPEQNARSAGTYTYLARQGSSASSPVGYDPCKPIEFRVNPAGAPQGYQDLVDDALDRVGAAAGLEFSDEGTTDDRPQWDETRIPIIFGEPKRQPVLISWADEDEVRQLRGRVAGIGGSVALDDKSGRARYITGGVTLDSTVFSRLMQSPRGRAEARAILLHELGHMVGLGHVNDPDELMNEDNLGLLDFGPGDLAGLARVGATPCA